MKFRQPEVMSILLLLIALAGCGQKGPLFLPGNPSEIRSIPDVQSSATEDEEEDDETDPQVP